MKPETSSAVPQSPAPSRAGHQQNGGKSFIPRFRRSASFRGEPGQGGPAARRPSSPDGGPRPLSRLSSFESVGGWPKERINGRCASAASSVVDGAQPEDDKCSMKSYGSCATFMSCDVGTLRRPESRGGGQSKTKYVLHCQRHVHTQEEYLTPTQRKDRQIRQLKAALVRATRALEKRDVEIERLKSEVERVRSSIGQHHEIQESGRSSPLLQIPPADASQSFPGDPPDAESKSERDIKQSQMQTDGDLAHRTYDASTTSSRDDAGGQQLEDSGILADMIGDDATEPDKADAMSHDLNPLPQDAARDNTNDDVDSGFCYSTADGGCKIGALKIGRSRLQDVPTDGIGSRRADGWRCGRPVTSRFPDYAAFQEKILRDLEYEKSSALLEDDLEAESSAEMLRSRGFMMEDVPAAADRFEKELDEARRRHSSEYQELKERYNDRIENLLQKLSEANARYSELRPLYDRSQDRIRQLENQVCELKKEMAAQEEWHSQMYLKMYRKGQEAAKFEHADEVLEFAHRAPKRVSVPELLQQLHRAEHELEEVKQMYRCELYKHARAGKDRQAEYTLKFLKDAVYYFLTEKDNRGHLRAIESILGFTDAERMAIAKALKGRRL